MPSIGHMKYVLGNVRIDHARLDEAFDLQQSALACWRKTLGEEQHKTGDAWHKMGWHFMRLRRWKEARYYVPSREKMLGLTDTCLLSLAETHWSRP